MSRAALAALAASLLVVAGFVAGDGSADTSTPHVDYPAALIEPLEYLEDALRPDLVDPEHLDPKRYACFEAVRSARDALEDVIFAMQFTFWRDGTGRYKGEPWTFSHEYYCERKRATYVDRPRETTRALELRCADIDGHRKMAIARHQAVEEAKRVVRESNRWCADMYRRREVSAREPR